MARFGLKRGTTPIIIGSGTVNADVIIDIKEERYRVTIKNLTLTAPGLGGAPITSNWEEICF